MSEKKLPGVVISLNSVQIDRTPDGPCFPHGKHITVFDMEYGARRLQIPISLALGEYDDARLVAVARSALHDFASQVVKATEAWSMPSDQEQADFPDGNWGRPS